MFGPTENVGQTKIVIGLTSKMHCRKRKLFDSSLKAKIDGKMSNTFSGVLPS